MKQPSEVEIVSNPISELCKGYLRARAPINKLLREGSAADALRASSESAYIYARDIEPCFAQKGAMDILLPDILRAVSTGGATDTFSAAVGSLAGLLVMQKDLGFLVNEILPIDLFMTDCSDELILFDNWASSRYGVYQQAQTWNGTTWNSTAPNTPSTVDVKVRMDQLTRIWIQFTMAQLSSTFRNLFGEQNKMALYSLAETMQNFMFNILFNGRADDSGATITYSGLPANAPGGKGDGTYLRSLTDFSPITDPPALALGLDLQKVPDLPNGGNRWTILNTAFYRKLTQDTNFMVAEAIANASQGVAANALGTGKLPTLQNINFRKSQMMADNYVLGGGGQTENFTAATRIGFAGAKESLVFCNRVPNDYTTAFNKLGIEVPPNARVEIVTEPRSGFRVMVVFAIDHGVDATSSIASANLLAYAMYGGAVGNPNVGFAISQQ